jgi:hypothetical protein
MKPAHQCTEHTWSYWHEFERSKMRMREETRQK